MITKEKLIELGFSIESLPSGRKVNLSHSKPFSINKIPSSILKGRNMLTVFYPVESFHESIIEVIIK